MPQVAFTTLGCKVNQFETEVIEGLFKQRGYAVVPFSGKADVYVINTCSVTHLGEKKSRQLIRRATRTNPEAAIVVTGCYAQTAPEKVETIPGVNVIVGTQDRQQIVDLVEEAVANQLQVKAVANIMAADHFEDIPLFHIPGRTRAFLKIQEGCTNFCTYCIIPFARGPLRSRPLSSVVSEAEKMVAAGFREIVLTGIHLGAYGRDHENNLELTDAIQAILDVKGLMRLRLGSLESIEISEQLINLMRKDKRLCPHLHLPLQSGHDHILSKMNRHYTTAEFEQLIESIRSQVDDIAISTDIIVGFPGETQEVFEEALAFVERMHFARIHVFPYSKREGTPAASFPGQIDEQDKKNRAHQLQVVADKAAKDFNNRFIGKIVDVLFEGEEDGVIDGLAGNYIRVYAPGDRSMQGQVCRVCVEKVYKDGVWGHITN